MTNNCNYCNKFKKCKNKGLFKIGSSYFCNNHSNILFNKHILTIQKYYRGYKSRKIINNIYKKLPDDIQNIIKSKINNNLHIKQYYKKLNKIIYNNKNKIHNYKFHNDKIDYNYIYNAYKLYCKYFPIIPHKDLQHFYVLGEQITYYFNILLGIVEFENINVYNIFKNIYTLNMSITEIYSTMNIIGTFFTIFNNHIQYNQNNTFY